MERTHDVVQSLGKKESEGPKRKRQALNADILKEELSGLLGRPVSDDSLRKLFPYIPGNDSGILPGKLLRICLLSDSSLCQILDVNIMHAWVLAEFA